MDSKEQCISLQNGSEHKSSLISDVKLFKASHAELFHNFKMCYFLFSLRINDQDSFSGFYYKEFYHVAFNKRPASFLRNAEMPQNDSSQYCNWFQNSARALLVSISPTCSLQNHQLPFYYVIKTALSTQASLKSFGLRIIPHTVIPPCLRCR